MEALTTIVFNVCIIFAVGCAFVWTNKHRKLWLKEAEINAKRAEISLRKTRLECLKAKMEFRDTRMKIKRGLL